MNRPRGDAVELMESAIVSSSSPSRRQFLASAGLAGAEALADEPRPKAPRADPARDLKPTAANLGSLFPDVAKLAEANRYAYSFLGDRFRALDDFKKVARAKILELLLSRPEKVDAKPEVIDRSDQGDYVREKIVFSTSPQFRVPAYVLIPKKVKTPAPAIVDLHSHGGMYLFGKEKVIDFGTNHPAMVDYHKHNYDGRPTATALVRRGYVVISIDAFFFGERRLLMDADLEHGWNRAKYRMKDVQHLNQQCRNKEPTLAKGLIFAGLTWPGIVVWDDIRTVDYLASRPEVDPKRIGCIGISMGGFRALFLTGLDERIAATCVTGFMSAVKPMIKAHLDIHSWVHFVPALHRYLDLPDVVSLAAPRPLLVQQCAKDQLFTPAGMKQAVDTIAAVYGKVRAKDKFAGRFYEEPHRFSKAMQEEAFDWFDQQLQSAR
jgi:cephalosporin-C deacetylase-like acetyl esterase